MWRVYPKACMMWFHSNTVKTWVDEPPWVLKKVSEMSTSLRAPALKYLPFGLRWLLRKAGRAGERHTLSSRLPRCDVRYRIARLLANSLGEGIAHRPLQVHQGDYAQERDIWPSKSTDIDKWWSILFSMRTSVIFPRQRDEMKHTRALSRGARNLEYSLEFCSDTHVVLTDTI